MSTQIYKINSEKKIYFAPVHTNQPYMQIMLTAAQKLGYTFIGENNQRWPYTPVTQDQPDIEAFIYFWGGRVPGSNVRQAIRRNIPYKKRYLLLLEPPIVDSFSNSRAAEKFFNKIITWNDIKIDRKKYFKAVFYRDFKQTYQRPFADKKLCCLVATNKESSLPHELYSERKKVIKFFEKNHPKDFDLYGLKWPASSYPLVYRGTTPDKTATLQQYKFCICYENIKNMYGYISEKIIDCLQAGCVPIYWGASNITDYIPQDCFIDRTKFDSLEDLYLYIKNMSEKEYNRYIFAANNYMTKEHSLFSSLYMADSFLQALIPQYKPELVFDIQQVAAIHALRAMHKKIQKRAQEYAR